MRERSIPCRGSSLRESQLGLHRTWADDGYCDRCRVLNARVRAQLSSSPTSLLEVGERGPRLSVSGPVPAGSAPTVLDARTASRGGSTFDDGLLSQPSGERDQAFPSRGTGPSRVGPLTTH